jgi:hypothetical protein
VSGAYRHAGRRRMIAGVGYDAILSPGRPDAGAPDTRLQRARRIPHLTGEARPGAGR